MGYALVLNSNSNNKEWHIYNAEFNNYDISCKVIEEESICSAFTTDCSKKYHLLRCIVNIEEIYKSPRLPFILNNKELYYYIKEDNFLYFKDIKDIRMFIGIYGNKKICGRCMSKLYSDKNIK